MVLVFSFSQPPVLAYSFDNNASRLTEYLEESFKSANFPDAAVTIVSKEKIEYSFGTGRIDTFDEEFVIGSTSKSFTALAIMQLVEDGKLSLTDSVSLYLDENIVPLEVSSNTTILQLLNQTSGIHDFYIKSISKLKEQGKFFYSNANYGLLGLIIENCSGISYEAYMDKHIFAPLNMTHSFATTSDNNKLNLLSGHQTLFGINIPSSLTWQPSMLPAGYIVSSPNDMANYLSMYLNQGFFGKNSILSTNYLDNMFQKTHPVEKNNPTAGVLENTAYGMGWFTGEHNGIPTYTHGGNVETYSSVMTLLPEEELGIVMLVSADDVLSGSALLSAINKGVIALLTGTEPTKISASTYWTTHAIANLFFVVLIFLSLVPILRLKKWKKSSSKLKSTLSILLHFLIPISLVLGISKLIGSPIDVIAGFSPDIAIIIGLFSLILLGTGIYKIIF